MRVSSFFLSSYQQTDLTKVARIPSDVTINNDATYNDSTDLSIPIQINSVYVIDMWLVFSSSAVADFKMTFKAITDATASWNPVDVHSPNALTDDQLFNGGGVGTDQCYHIHGVLTTGAGSTENLIVRYCQANAEATDTVLSSKTALVLTKVA